MALVKNSALSLISQILDLPTSQLASVVNLDDGDVSLTLPIFPELTRRGLAGIRSGWFQGRLENVHSGADDESSTLDPYVPGASAAAPYPPLVPADFDVWLLNATLMRTLGAGTLVEGWARLILPSNQLGVGIDDAGDPVTGSLNTCIARFTDIIAAPGGLSNDQGVGPDGLPIQWIRTRIPRGATINFASTSATASATFSLLLTMGLFPSSLGQDVVA